MLSACATLTISLSVTLLSGGKFEYCDKAVGVVPVSEGFNLIEDFMSFRCGQDSVSRAAMRTAHGFFNAPQATYGGAIVVAGAAIVDEQRAGHGWLEIA
jgi:hypothetical protein